MKYGWLRGPEEDGCHKLEDTCTQKRRLEDGREGGQGPTRTVEPWSSSCSSTEDGPLEPKHDYTYIYIYIYIYIYMVGQK